MHVHVARCDIVLHTIHVYILKDNEKLCDASIATCMQVCVCVWGGGRGIVIKGHYLIGYNTVCL